MLGVYFLYDDFIYKYYFKNKYVQNQLKTNKKSYIATKINLNNNYFSLE